MGGGGRVGRGSSDEERRRKRKRKRREGCFYANDLLFSPRSLLRASRRPPPAGPLFKGPPDPAGHKKAEVDSLSKNILKIGSFLNIIVLLL